MSRRWLVAGLGLTLAMALGAAALAQPAFDQIRDLIERGYYNSAAQLNGPELIEAYPDRPEAHYLYARALYLTGDAAAARARLNHAIELAGNDEDPEMVHLNGLLRAAEGDTAGALRALRTAFVRSQRYAHAMDWGRVAWQVGQYQDALDAFTAAADTPRGARELWPHLNRGRILMYLGETELAIDALLEAINVFDAVDPGGTRPPSPGYVEAYFRLGEAYEALGSLEIAETFYRSARSSDPNYTPAAAALDRISRRAP